MVLKYCNLIYPCLFARAGSFRGMSKTTGVLAGYGLRERQRAQPMAACISSQWRTRFPRPATKRRSGVSIA